MPPIPCSEVNDEIDFASNIYKLYSGMNQINETSANKKEQNLIETLAIRSMAKAAYSTDNIGHYGLSFDYYTHFTSPIRRYPDVMVHRLLTHYLNGGKALVSYGILRNINSKNNKNTKNKNLNEKNDKNKKLNANNYINADDNNNANTNINNKANVANNNNLNNNNVNDQKEDINVLIAQ